MNDPEVVVGVVTYRRPKMLSHLLDSLVPTISTHSKARVLVVDNDPEGSASEIVRIHRVGAEYLLETRPGIAHARNTVISEALGADFIAFIDDDEEASENWLAELLAIAHSTGAGLVAGPVPSRLPEDAPPFIANSGIFDRPPRPDGATVSEAGSGNLLCRLEVFTARPPLEWFSLELGEWGGSDAELTRRLHREGTQIAWAANAVAIEGVPPERVTLRWLSRRYRRLGAVDYRIDPRVRFKQLRWAASGATRILVAVIPLGWSFLTPTLNAKAFRRFFRGIGMLEAVIGQGHREYGRR